MPLGHFGHTHHLCLRMYVKTITYSTRTLLQNIFTRNISNYYAVQCLKSLAVCISVQIKHSVISHISIRLMHKTVHVLVLHSCSCLSINSYPADSPYITK